MENEENNITLEFPTLSGRLQRINPGIYYALFSVERLIKTGKLVSIANINDFLNKSSLLRYKKAVGEAVQLLMDDEVLVDKDSDGRLKLDLSLLEDRIEIYNETP